MLKIKGKKKITISHGFFFVYLKLCFQWKPIFSSGRASSDGSREDCIDVQVHRSLYKALSMKILCAISCVEALTN